MSAMSNQATHAITLDHDEYKALIAVVEYLLDSERTSYEECEGDIKMLNNHIWWKARTLFHALNLYPTNEGVTPC
jgi:hypothetical protein